MREDHHRASIKSIIHE